MCFLAFSFGFMTKERIKIVGQMPEYIRLADERWLLSLTESVRSLAVGFLHTRFMNGPDTPNEMCRRSWQSNDSTVLVYTDHFGEEREIPVLAVRTSDEAGITFHDFWVQLPED